MIHVVLALTPDPPKLQSLVASQFTMDLPLGFRANWFVYILSSPPVCLATHQKSQAVAEKLYNQGESAQFILLKHPNPGREGPVIKVSPG